MGLDSDNPSGDGSGVVKFTATADNTVNFSFRFGTGDSEESSSGVVEYTYTNTGTNTYSVNVLAYSLLHVFRESLPKVLKKSSMYPIGASYTWRLYGYENSWVNVDGLMIHSV